MRSRLTPAQAAIRHAIRQSLQRHLSANQKIVVAVSGGADSLALASATLFEAKKLKLALLAAIIDHGLQQKSAEVAKRTSQLLSEIGFEEVVIKKVKVGRKGGLEAAARAARYQALEEIRVQEKADFILLGHTLDDQAETVLLGLARGSGARSLSGMQEKTGHLLRPLLSIERTQTIRFCKDEKLKFWSDPQNEDNSFLRVRVRKRILPFLEKQLATPIAKNLARTADQLREDDELLSELAKKKLKLLSTKSGKSIRLDCEKLALEPKAMVNRILKQALADFGIESSRTHVLGAADLVFDWHGQKPLHLAGVRVSRKGKVISITPNQE